MIHIHSHEPLLGDCISQLPFMYALAQERDQRVRLTGSNFNRAVTPLLRGAPIDLDLDGTAQGAEFQLHVMDSYKLSLDTGLHMAQAYFQHFGLPVPPLPLDLPLSSEPCDLPSGIVISPFTGSDPDGTRKRWPHERWVEVVRRLRDVGLADIVYVIGRSSTDSTEPYDAHGITRVFDYPLSQILDLMRRAPAVLTIDTGTGHLAHIGGISRHVMLYPDCMPPKFAEAPRAVHVRGPNPIGIPVDPVFEAVKHVLQTP